jgi:hypothetical protein
METEAYQAPCWACDVLVTKARGIRRLQAVDDAMMLREPEDGMTDALKVVRRAMFALRQDIKALTHSSHSAIPDVDAVTG